MWSRKERCLKHNWGEAETAADESATLLWVVCATRVAWERMSGRPEWPMGELLWESSYTQRLRSLGWARLMVSGCTAAPLHRRESIPDKPSLKGIFLPLKSHLVPCPTASFRWFVDEKVKLWSFFFWSSLFEACRHHGDEDQEGFWLQCREMNNYGWNTWKNDPYSTFVFM